MKAEPKMMDKIKWFWKDLDNYLIFRPVLIKVIATPIFLICVYRFVFYLITRKAAPFIWPWKLDGEIPLLPFTAMTWVYWLIFLAIFIGTIMYGKNNIHDPDGYTRPSSILALYSGWICLNLLLLFGQFL